MYTSQGLLANKITIKDYRDYLPLVKNQAYLLQRKINYQVELDDLVQSGTIGLLDALEKYEYNSNAKFETYAQQRIWGAMIDELRKNDVVSQEYRSLLNRIEQSKNKWKHEYGINPTEKQISSICNISIEKYQELMQLQNAINVISHDEKDVKSLVENIADDKPTTEMEIINEQLKALLVKEIDILSEREKYVLALYYTEEMTFKEIAHVLDLTEARISQDRKSVV